MRQFIGPVWRGLAAAVLLSAYACAAPPAEAPRRLTLLPDVGARPSTRPIDGLTISAMYGGALRCAIKVLTR